MATDPPPAGQPPRPPARPAPQQRSTPSAPLDFRRPPRVAPAFQFGTRAVLLTMTVAAVLLTIASFVGFEFFSTAMTLAVAWICMSLMPVGFGTLALYCRGMRQTFFLGAFVGSVLPLCVGDAGLARGGSGGSLVVVALMILLLVATALVSGWVAILTRRFAERRNWHLPPRPHEKDSVD